MYPSGPKYYKSLWCHSVVTVLEGHRVVIFINHLDGVQSENVRPHSKHPHTRLSVVCPQINS